MVSVSGWGNTSAEAEGVLVGPGRTRHALAGALVVGLRVAHVARAVALGDVPLGLRRRVARARVAPSGSGFMV